MKIKHFAALFTALVMTAYPFAPLAQALDGDNDISSVNVVSDSFSDYNGGIPSGYKSNSADLLNEDGAVHINKGGTLTKEFDDALDGKIVMSASVRVHARGTESFLFDLKSANGKEFSGVHLTPKGQIRVFNGKSIWAGETVGEYKTNIWSTYKLEYDTVNKAVSLYVDDKLLTENLPIENSVENIKSVTFKCTSACADIDNVEISQQSNSVSEADIDTSSDTFLMIGSSKAKYKDNVMRLSVLDPSVKTFERNNEVYVPLLFLLEAYEIPSTLNTDDGSRKFNIGDTSYTVFKSGFEFKIDRNLCKSKNEIITENSVTYLPLDMVKSIFSKSSAREGDIIVLTDSEISKSKYNAEFHKAEIQLGHSGAGAKADILDFSEAVSMFPEDIIDRMQLSATGASMKIVDVDDDSVSFKKALSIDTQIQPKNYWDSKVYFNVNSYDVKKNDVCLISFYARTTRATDESTNAQTEAVFEEQNTPWTKSGVAAIAMDGIWRKYYVPFAAVIDHPAGTAQFNLRIGYKSQTFEVADIKMYNFGTKYKLGDMPVTVAEYPGIEDDAQWRKDALENVEKNKKKALTVNVTDMSGNPVRGARVTVKETNPSFKWGTSVNQWLITGQNYNTTEEGKKNMQMYRDTLLDYFNLAVPENALKWNFWVDGRAVNSRMCIDWLVDHGIEVKGHYLYWDSTGSVPTKYQSMMKDRPEEFNKVINQHIYDFASEFKNDITIWDAINECSAHRVVLNQLGEIKLKEWFDTAKRANPDAVLYINETALVGTENFQHKTLTRILKDMIKNGVDFDGVGLQGHFGAVPDPQAFLKQIEHFAEVSGGKRIMLTEYDMLSQDEDIQSDFIRDIMIACYSNANTDGFIMWGHWDSDHWRRNAPNFRADWTIKPAGQTWYRLSKYVWNTNVEGLSDDDGKYSVGAYQGKYEVTVEKDGLTKTINCEVANDGEITINF